MHHTLSAFSFKVNLQWILSSTLSFHLNSVPLSPAAFQWARNRDYSKNEIVAVKVIQWHEQQWRKHSVKKHTNMMTELNLNEHLAGICLHTQVKLRSLSYAAEQWPENIMMSQWS